MKQHRIQFLNWAAVAIAIAGGIVAWGLSIGLPYNAVVAEGNSRVAAASKSAAATELPTLEEFETLWDLPLRQPLVEPEPEVVVKPLANLAPTAAPIRLVGTVIEPERSKALLRLPSGNLEWRAVGEMAGDIGIVRIASDAVVVRQGGRDITIPLEKRQK